MMSAPPSATMQTKASSWEDVGAMVSYDTTMTAFEAEIAVNEEAQPSEGSGATRFRSVQTSAWRTARLHGSQRL